MPFKLLIAQEKDQSNSQIPKTIFQVFLTTLDSTSKNKRRGRGSWNWPFFGFWFLEENILRSGWFGRKPFSRETTSLVGRLSGLAWSVVQTNAPATASVNLERQEFVYYNPRIKLRSSGRIAQLFPNYMFVAAIAERWRALLATKGIVRLLMSGVEQPATISQEVIDQLRAREVGGLVKLDQRRFRENQTVQVQRGVFAQQLAIYNGQCGSDRAFVLLRWLGAQRRVKIDEDNLAAV